MSLRALMFYNCKFHDKTDDASCCTKCWLHFLLRAPVGTGETYRGKGQKFDFFHILTLDKVGYN